MKFFIVKMDMEHGRPVYIALPRVGINYAAPTDRDRLWRFLVK